MSWGGGVMRRRTASKRGRLLPLFAACVFGYLTGAWHVAALREAGHGSAAEVVAQRFPQEWTKPPAVALAAVRNSRAEPDLFSPAPMAPPLQSQSNAEQPVEKSTTLAAERRVVQTASLDTVAPPLANAADLAPRRAAVAAAKASAARPPVASRILDDAQIVSIKTRLHLTPDQERMWPAVEAALRNMAYKRTQQAAARGPARNAQAAAVDPEAVEGLKSAAVPLIMSFSSEQKEEVRSLAHVMGLGQLASQF
jgi:hypothetical protein